MSTKLNITEEQAEHVASLLGQSFKRLRVLSDSEAFIQLETAGGENRIIQINANESTVLLYYNNGRRNGYDLRPINALPAIDYLRAEGIFAMPTPKIKASTSFVEKPFGKTNYANYEGSLWGDVFQFDAPWDWH